jgi:hypothetical protein
MGAKVVGIGAFGCRSGFEKRTLQRPFFCCAQSAGKQSVTASLNQLILLAYEVDHGANPLCVRGADEGCVIEAPPIHGLKFRELFSDKAEIGFL